MTCSCNEFLIASSGGLALGGNAEATSTIVKSNGGVKVGGSGAVDCTQVWAQFAAVYHLQESGDGTPNEYQDSTAHNYHGQGGLGFAYQVPEIDAGPFCLFSQLCDGKQFVTLPNIVANHGITVSAWGRINGYYHSRVFVSKSNLRLGYSLLRQVTAEVDLADGTTLALVGSSRLKLDHWYYWAATWQPGLGLTVYVNGVADGFLADTSMALAASSGAWIGKHGDRGHLEGNIMEVRIGGVRTSDYLLAEYNNFCDGDFYEVGDEGG